MDQVLGIYRKYDVRWKPDREADVDLRQCDLFVLDLMHDKFSGPALEAYVEAWQKDNPGKCMEPSQPYTVTRITDPNGKHKNCRYFVLNATTDPHAIVALRRYRLECQTEYPKLFLDLGDVVRRNTVGQATRNQGDG